MRRCIALFWLLSFISAACSRTPSTPPNDFASSIVVQGTVRDSLGTLLHGAPVTAIGFGADTCSGFTWSSDSTATDSVGHYYCRLSNFGRPQSVKATATAPAGHPVATRSSCRTDLELAAPTWQDTLVVEFTLGGP